jgi:PrcB C-terminal
MTDVSTLARGDGSGVTHPRRVVIRDEPAWRALWAEHAGAASAPPRVDFSTQMVAAVFAGDRPTPGYTVEIVDARQQGDRLGIVVAESRPAPGTLAAQVIVTPFHIVALPRFDGGVSFI